MEYILAFNVSERGDISYYLFIIQYLLIHFALCCFIGVKGNTVLTHIEDNYNI